MALIFDITIIDRLKKHQKDNVAQLTPHSQSINHAAFT